MKNNYHVLSLFPSPLVSTIVEEDTDGLNRHKVFVTSTYDDSSECTENIDFDNRHNVLVYYPQIKNILLNKFKEYCNDRLYYNNDFRITTSWITNTEKGALSQLHIHKNSFYSGVYYFQDDYPEDSAPLEFNSPLVQLSDYLLIPEKYEVINSHSWRIFPRPKLLIFFPSYLNHQVLLHNIDKSRRSLAFNIIPIGKYGMEDSLHMD